MPDIPIGAIDRILRHSGASRVSIDASKELRYILEEYGLIIGKKALELVSHRGKQTLTKEDIRLAYKFLVNNK
ncbi:MAG: histone family protein [Candidatus Hodarchaeales archaeon]|jgi:histone H3/H4